jgi:hypothetical protein
MPTKLLARPRWYNHLQSVVGNETRGE